MTGEVPQPEVPGEIQPLDLSGYSGEEVLRLNKELSHALDGYLDDPSLPDPHPQIEALTSGLGQYPTTDFERGIRLFELLGRSGDDDHHFRAACAITGLLQAAEMNGESEQRRARGLWRSLLLHQDPDTSMVAKSETVKSIREQRLKPETVAALFTTVASELQDVYADGIPPGGH